MNQTDLSQRKQFWDAPSGGVSRGQTSIYIPIGGHVNLRFSQRSCNIRLSTWPDSVPATDAPPTLLALRAAYAKHGETLHYIVVSNTI